MSDAKITDYQSGIQYLSLITYNLYFNFSLENLEYITFQIYSSDDEIIHKDDVILILSYISCQDKIFNLIEI